MPTDDLTARLAREPVKIDCPICRHHQWLGETRGRCEQCGSEILIYDDRDAARGALQGILDEGRAAYLREPQEGLFAVVANRSFRKKPGA